MRLIKENDLFEIRLLTRFSSEDFRVLNLLYQPFLGHLAVNIFQTLVNTADLYKDGPLSHDFVYKHLDTTSLDFANAIVKLEACELVRTYVDKTKEFSYYYYELYAPKLAHSFLKDPVFSGLLKASVGERRVQQLISLFAFDRPYALDEKEITSSFSQVYNPDFNGAAFTQTIDTKRIGRNENKRTSPFNIELFKEILRQNFMIIADKAISQQELKRLVSLTMVYGFNEETLAAQVGESYRGKLPLGKRLNFEYIEQNLKQLNRYEHIAKPKRLRPLNMLTSDSEKAKLINRMEIEPSLDFLTSFNKGAIVADSELKLLLRLSNDFNLSSAAINAIIYHVLMTMEMQLPAKYVEKIAANISRLGLVHAVDVINHFEQQNEIRKPKSYPKKKEAVKEFLDDEEISDEEYQKLLEEIKGV